MNSILLRDKFKELIGNSRIEAALFMSFNFDADFFENYLLPLFLPDVAFSDNKIQNSIFWRKYQSELPPIAVLCDFHVKGSEAPNLGYEVHSINLPKAKGIIPCFHFKHCFILTNDQRLIVTTGSNNLTYAGWCRNLEITSIDVFKNGENFPRNYKDAFRKMLRSVATAFINDSAFEKQDSQLRIILAMLDSFFGKTKYTPDILQEYWHSGLKPFEQFLGGLLKDEVMEVEIISPYFGDTALMQKLPLTGGEIRIAVPQIANEKITITNLLFEQLKDQGAVWSRMKMEIGDKQFRFNHSKIYRIRTTNQSITIVGSVNFTDMAWKSMKEGGNAESCVSFVENVSNWEPWLTPLSTDEMTRLSFETNPDAEAQRLERLYVPNLAFTLDWATQEIYVENPKEEYCILSLLNQNREVRNLHHTFSLTLEQFNDLADNPVIKIQYQKRQILYFPRQLNVEQKPLSSKLRLEDRQIFALWNELLDKSTNKDRENQLVQMLSSRLNEGGDIKIETDLKPSALNKMAMHLSGLISLEKALFNSKVINERMVKYYLINDNIDTLPGYLKILNEYSSKNEILGGFYWLLLTIVKDRFYNNKHCVKFEPDHLAAIKKHSLKIDHKIKELEQKITTVDQRFLKWARKQVNYDAKW